MKRATITLFVILGAAIFALLSFPAFVGLITDWWWFSSIEFEQIFLRTLLTKLALGLSAGVVAFAFFYVNFRMAQRGAVPDPIVVNINSKTSKLDITRGLRAMVFPVSVVLALITGLSAAGAWSTVLQFLHRTPFGMADPVFGRDVGFYVFALPAVQAGIDFGRALVVVALFMVLPLYLMRGDIVFLRNRATVEPSAQTHLGILVAMLFIAAAVNTYLVRMPSLLYSTTGPIFGASHTDLVARLPMMQLAGLLGLLCAAWVIWGAVKRDLVRHVTVSVLAYFVFVGLVGAAFPAGMQKLVVVPNELDKERQQIEHHLAATRRAWGLDAVVVRDLSGEAPLTLEDIQANRGTIKNVRLWDRDPLLQTFGQLQEIRTYYDFVSVDDDRYMIDGEYRQVLLSPRELNTQSLPNRSFPNERLTFTHGMGLTLSPVNQVTAEGLPVLFIKDLPPRSDVSIQVTRPEIYFGELSSDWVFINTGQPEFDYPSGDSSAFTSYRGTGGLQVRGLVRKVLFSARFQSLKILLSQDISGESRVLFHRNIRERAALALPFLEWDSDPYIVIAEDGRLVWMMDAYTVSRRYPYSARMADGVNYMRNSVKVVIDAYDGTVSAYIADPDDPIIQTFDKIYPGVLQPLDAMPSDLRTHIRYPEDLFRAQTQLYTVYHMDQPDVFYHREDQWQIPTVIGRDASRDPFLRHIVMKLPGETTEEFIFMTPYTPREKDNLAAWLVARNDGDKYGQLVVYRFPRQSLVFGPTQIANRINQNTEISRQISLWDQRGSEVIRGNLLVIPIEEALVFVQALYLRAEGGRIPELKRVVVAYQNQVVMEETLDRGLTRLFGGTAESELPPVELPIGAEAAALRGLDALPGLDVERGVEDLALQAADAYDRAIAAQRAGDWAGYGREIQRLGTILQQIRERAQTGTSDGG